MPRRRPRSTNVVGVAIDGDVIRGVHVRSRLGRHRVVHCAEVELPVGITDHGRIVDGDGFSHALRDLWRKGGFRTKHLAFGVDGRDATFRRLSLPIDAAEHVVDAARYELSSYLPYDLDDAVTDIQEIARTTEAVDVVAVALRCSTLEMIAAAAAGAGLSLRDITLSSSALGLSVADRSNRDSTIVSVDGASTTVVVRRDGRATVTRVLTGGGGERSTQAVDELEEALATVDQFRLGSDTDRPADDPQLRRFDTVVEEVAAAIRFEESQQTTESGRIGVDLAGAYGADAALVELMSAGVDAAVTLVSAPEWWNDDYPFLPYTTTVGVALTAFDLDPGVVHLGVPSLIARRRRRREYAMGLVAAAALAVPAGHTVEIARDDARRAVGNAESAESQADVLSARAEGFDELSTLQADVLGRRRIQNEALAGEVWWPRVLDEIAGVIPDETFLTSFSLRRPPFDPTIDDSDATATFSAIALDQNGTAEWLLAVESLDIVDEVWLVQSSASVFGELELPVVALIGEGHLTEVARTPRSEGLDPGAIS